MVQDDNPSTGSESDEAETPLNGRSPEDDGSSGGGRFGGRRALPIFGAIGVVVTAFVIFVLIGLAGGDGDGDGPAGDDGDDGTLHGGLASTRRPTPRATLDLTRPTVVPTIDPDTPLPGESENDRIVIEKFGIDAPITLREVNASGVMPNPNGPDDVAYYNFDRQVWPSLGGVPGWGGNVVLAGHVDSGHAYCDNGKTPPPCTAVFWDVSLLEVGDQIEIHYSDEVFVYRVTSNEAVPAASAPWDQIVSATADETITLITCGGDFNRNTGAYDSRQVIAGVRVT